MTGNLINFWNFSLSLKAILKASESNSLTVSSECFSITSEIQIWPVNRNSMLITLYV